MILFHFKNEKIIQMKKNYFFAKSFLILAASSLIVTSCMTDTEGPLEESILTEKALEVTDSEGGENLRKGKTLKYQEKFINEIELQFIGSALFLPGEGTGNATFMGKAKSYINQMVVSENQSIGAPVSLIYENDLKDLGIENLPDNVHSVTVDKKGNAIFFSTPENNAVEVNDERTEFSAIVFIIGGTGIFKDASGKGIVNGFYNPNTFIGETVLSADITFN